MQHTPYQHDSRSRYQPVPDMTLGNWLKATLNRFPSGLLVWDEDVREFVPLGEMIKSLPRTKADEPAFSYFEGGYIHVNGYVITT